MGDVLGQAGALRDGEEWRVDGFEGVSGAEDD